MKSQQVLLRAVVLALAGSSVLAGRTLNQYGGYGGGYTGYGGLGSGLGFGKGKGGLGMTTQLVAVGTPLMMAPQMLAPVYTAPVMQVPMQQQLAPTQVAPAQQPTQPTQVGPDQTSPPDDKDKHKKDKSFPPVTYEIKLPEFPKMPKFTMHELPKVNLTMPSLPKVNFTMPKMPKMPQMHAPNITFKVIHLQPKITLPPFPNISIPAAPKMQLPAVPSINFAPQITLNKPGPEPPLTFGSKLHFGKAAPAANATKA